MLLQTWFTNSHIISIVIIPISLILFVILGLIAWRKVVDDKLTAENIKKRWGFWRRMLPYFIVAFAAFALVTAIAFTKQLF